MSYSSIVALVCFACHIFVSWKTGPKWWTQISYYVYVGFAVTAYIAVPVVNMVYFIVWVAVDGALSYNSIYLCWKVAYFTYCIGFLVAFSSGEFRSLRTYAQTYIQLRKSIENKTDEEVTDYLRIQKFDQLNPKAQQLMMQQVRQIRGTVVPYVL